MLNKLEEQLIVHEGLCLKPYTDTVGKLSIGVGRNLDDVGISRDEAITMLRVDIARVVKQLDTHVRWWSLLTEARQLVLADMCFNLGINRLLGFKKMFGYLVTQKYDKAADEMLNSKWATQVGNRAHKLAEMMRNG